MSKNYNLKIILMPNKLLKRASKIDLIPTAQSLKLEASKAYSSYSALIMPIPITLTASSSTLICRNFD